jgi:hypothetical protein
LFALYRLHGAGLRTSGFVHVAARWRDAEVTLVRDSAGEEAVTMTPWTPRIND